MSDSEDNKAKLQKLLITLKNTRKELEELEGLPPIDTEEIEALKMELNQLKSKYATNAKWIKTHPPVERHLAEKKNGCDHVHIDIVRDPLNIPDKQPGKVNTYKPKPEEQICYPTPYQTDSCYQNLSVIATVKWDKTKQSKKE